MISRRVGSNLPGLKTAEQPACSQPTLHSLLNPRTDAVCIQESPALPELSVSGNCYNWVILKNTPLSPLTHPDLFLKWHILHSASFHFLSQYLQFRKLIFSCCFLLVFKFKKQGGVYVTYRAQNQGFSVESWFALKWEYYRNKRDRPPVKRVKMKYIPLTRECRGLLNKLNLSVNIAVPWIIKSHFTSCMENYSGVQELLFY